MREVDRLTHLAVVLLKPAEARVDLVPVVIDPDRPASRFGPKPRFVPDENG
jgi:hypothetical protein